MILAMVIADDELLRFARTAAAAWPSFDVPLDAFAAHVEGRLEPTETAAALERIHGADLFLACACLHGDEVAWRELYRLHLAHVEQFVARVDASSAFADEVRQRLVAKLVRAEQGPPKLALYTGRGPLGAWLRVASIREAQSLKRRGKRSVDADDAALAIANHDPEGLLVTHRMAAEFKAAFEAVLMTLTTDERNVLRLHYSEGLTIEEVGKAYRVSRATAARWIASARQTIIARTHGALTERMGASAPNAGNLLAIVGSQFDMSLHRHLK